ncbi:MAG: class I SAM-dependent methyltransferase [Chloroflexi bacterium]|nr:MAG: class I SAM-dependent methyltransferase [Chloroflexota bacterium]
MNHQDHVGLLKAAVPPGVATWADLGSGTGAFTLALADLLGPGARIVSVDRDGGALREQARTMGERFPEVALDQRQADFTGELQLPPLDGLLMANSLHFVRDKRELLPRLLGAIRPRGRFVLVEYDVDQGNPWVPYPVSFKAWRAMAGDLALLATRLAGRVPSRFLDSIYSAVSEVPSTPPARPGQGAFGTTIR